jgi:hypothetical protein
VNNLKLFTTVMLNDPFPVITSDEPTTKSKKE